MEAHTLPEKQNELFQIIIIIDDFADDLRLHSTHRSRFVQKLTHRPPIGIPLPISRGRALRQRTQATNDVTSSMRNFRMTNEEWAILLRAGCVC